MPTPNFWDHSISAMAFETFSNCLGVLDFATDIAMDGDKTAKLLLYAVAPFMADWIRRSRTY